jgi:hypothetical protein
MARTAPVPNAIAIPGMNPGIFIMGGGGDGGGSGPGGGKGKGKGQGGNGKGGGNGANGDGKGAGGCGAGSGGGCPNPAHGRGGGTHAGDPVDPITGRVYTIPQTDLPLVGPLVFALKRGYSSFANERDIGLGFGWSHSLAWSIEVHAALNQHGDLVWIAPTGAVSRAIISKLPRCARASGGGCEIFAWGQPCGYWPRMYRPDLRWPT